MNKSDDISKIVPAFLKVLSEVQNPAFDSTNPHFKNKYASLRAVTETIKPLLIDNALGVTQFLGSRDGLVVCETLLLHESSQWLSAEFAVPSSKQDAQGFGSAASYARRYALMAFFGIAGEDDDGTAASSPEQKRRQSTRQPAQQLPVEDDEDAPPTTYLLFGRGKKYRQWDNTQTGKWVKETYGVWVSSLSPDQLADACKKIKAKEEA